MKSFSFVIAAILSACLGLTACQTSPTATQQVTVAVLIDAAVGIAVQNGSKDPDVWSQRAAKIVTVASQLQALDKGDVATLPALTSALGPLITKANLGPAEQLAANALIAALSQVIEQNKDKLGMPTEAAIQLVLTNVINAASVYVHPVV